MKTCTRPFCITSEQWKRINQWITGRDPETDEFSKEQAERLQKMAEESKEMTKSWPNSLENVTKRNQEMRELRIKRSLEINQKFYEDYCKKREQHEAMMRQIAEDKAFTDSDAPKMLLSALVESEIQRERQAQIKYDAAQKNDCEDLEKQYVEFVTKDAENFHKEKKEKLEDIRRKCVKNKAEVCQQICENKSRTEKEQNEKIEEERLANAKAQQEIEEENIRKKKAKEAERARVLADMQLSRELAEKRCKEEEERDKLEEKLQNLYRQQLQMFEKQRKDAENERKQNKLNYYEIVKSKIATCSDNRDQKEEEILKNAQAKQLADEIERYENERKHVQEMRSERQKARSDYLCDQERKKHEEETMHAWEVLNRFKNAELLRDYEASCNTSNSEDKEKYRKEIVAQWQERIENDANEVYENRQFYGENAENALRRADMRVLKYAEDLLEESRQVGRPEYPIKKVVEKYKGLRRLYPLPDLKGSLKEHFPEYKAEDKTDYKNMPMYKPGPRDGLQIKQILQDPKHLDGGLCPCVQEISDKRDGLRNRKQKSSFPNGQPHLKPKENRTMPQIICKQIAKKKVLDQAF